MYKIDGFLAVYGLNGRFLGVQAKDKFFEAQEFKIWAGNVKRRLFVEKISGLALYHYGDLTNDEPLYWYSLDCQDWNGLSRVKAKEVSEQIEIKEKGNA